MEEGTRHGGGSGLWGGVTHLEVIGYNVPPAGYATPRTLRPTIIVAESDLIYWACTCRYPLLEYAG